MRQKAQKLKNVNFVKHIILIYIFAKIKILPWNFLIMNKSINIFDNDYLQWIQDLCKRYRQSQIKASMQINKGILAFYWELGKDIEERKYDNKYGSRFYENLSHDLSKVLNDKKGLAPTSLRGFL